jgi:hypothetical protein
MRSILRHCAKLPDLKRRLAYFRTCIKRLAFPNDEEMSKAEQEAIKLLDTLELLDDYERRELTPDDWAEIGKARRIQIEMERPPYEKLKRRMGENQTEALYNQLSHVLLKRYESDPWKAVDRLDRLIVSAVEKPYPAGWLRKVIENERKELKVGRRHG